MINVTILKLIRNAFTAGSVEGLHQVILLLPAVSDQDIVDTFSSITYDQVREWDRSNPLRSARGSEEGANRIILEKSREIIGESLNPAFDYLTKPEFLLAEFQWKKNPATRERNAISAHNAFSPTGFRHYPAFYGGSKGNPSSLATPIGILMMARLMAEFKREDLSSEQLDGLWESIDELDFSMDVRRVLLVVTMELLDPNNNPFGTITFKGDSSGTSHQKDWRGVTFLGLGVFDRANYSDDARGRGELIVEHVLQTFFLQRGKWEDKHDNYHSPSGFDWNQEHVFDLSHSLWIDCALDGLTLRDVNFSDAMFVHCRFIGLQTGGRANRLNYASISFERARIWYCDFFVCRLEGVIFKNAECVNTTFNHTKLLANLHGKDFLQGFRPQYWVGETFGENSGPPLQMYNLILKAHDNPELWNQIRLLIDSDPDLLEGIVAPKATVVDVGYNSSQMTQNEERARVEAFSQILMGDYEYVSPVHGGDRTNLTFMQDHIPLTGGGREPYVAISSASRTMASVVVGMPVDLYFRAVGIDPLYKGSLFNNASSSYDETWMIHSHVSPWTEGQKMVQREDRWYQYKKVNWNKRFFWSVAIKREIDAPSTISPATGEVSPPYRKPNLGKIVGHKHAERVDGELAHFMAPAPTWAIALFEVSDGFRLKWFGPKNLAEGRNTMVNHDIWFVKRGQGPEDWEDWEGTVVSQTLEEAFIWNLYRILFEFEERYREFGLQSDSDLNVEKWEDWVLQAMSLTGWQKEVWEEALQSTYDGWNADFNNLSNPAKVQDAIEMAAEEDEEWLRETIADEVEWEDNFEFERDSEEFDEEVEARLELSLDERKSEAKGYIERYKRLYKIAKDKAYAEIGEAPIGDPVVYPSYKFAEVMREFFDYVEVGEYNYGADREEGEILTQAINHSLEWAEQEMDEDNEDVDSLYTQSLVVGGLIDVARGRNMAPPGYMLRPENFIFWHATIHSTQQLAQRPRTVYHAESDSLYVTPAPWS